MMERKGFSFGVRHQQCVLLFCSMALGYALQTDLSLAIVAMTDRNTANPNFKEYDWDEKTKSTVLGSFMWGYLVTQIPGGQLASRFGGKHLLLIAIFVCSLISLLTPACAAIGGWELVCAARALQGIFQGVTFPSAHSLLSKWSPIEERGYLAMICYSGLQFGTVVMMSTSGLVASSDLGWPGIFYIWGCLGVVWCIVWYFYGANCPAEHRNISQHEKEMIEKSIGQEDNTPKKHLKTPWKDILTSVPFLTLFFVMAVQDWSFWLLLAELPNYVSGVLGMDIRSNALLSAIPHLTMLILCYVFWFFANLIEKNKNISLTMSRKIFNTIGCAIPGMGLIALGFIRRENYTLAIVLLTIILGSTAGVYFGFYVNLIDLSPNFAGILMGIGNCAGTITGFLSIFTVGFVVHDQTDPHQWQIVYSVAGVLCLLASTAFLIFGTADVQPWDSGTTSTQNTKNQRTDNVTC